MDIMHIKSNLLMGLQVIELVNLRNEIIKELTLLLMSLTMLRADIQITNQKKENLTTKTVMVRSAIAELLTK